MLNRSPLQMTIFGSAGCWLVDGLLCVVKGKTLRGIMLGFPGWSGLLEGVTEPLQKQWGKG